MRVYAVRKGFVRGIYTSWGDCERQVEDYSEADFRCFRTQEEAVRFLKN